MSPNAAADEHGALRALGVWTSSGWTFVRFTRSATFNSIRPVIYCVVPEELSDQLFDKLTSYYSDDPNVTVIVDRRKSVAPRGRELGRGRPATVRDRRRPRVTGELPELASD